MQDPLLPTKVPPEPSVSPPMRRSTEDDAVMVDVEDLVSSDDDSFGSDFDALTEADIDDVPEIPEHNPPTYSKALSTPTPSVSLAPSPPPSRNVLEKSSKPEPVELRPPPYARQGMMCVICKVRPVYSDGQRAFPTCGTTCAQKLEAASIPQSTIMQGQMNNPLNAYNTRSSSSSHHPYGFSAWQTQPSRSPQIRMCEVCHVRPKCQRGGKIYPTCGLTCASKLNAPGTVEMCDFCKKRPKVVLNGKTYPQCGRTCRDNAKQADVAANSAACTTCLVCWKAEKTGAWGDLCSAACKAAVEGRAPVLIEVPRGHASFTKVMNAFADSWKKSKTSASSPRIKKIYMVCIKGSAAAKHEQYRNRINSSTPFYRKPAGTMGWLGTPRECGFGDPGNVEPCSSNRCLLCSIVKSFVSRENFPEGIPTTNLPRAIEAASNIRKRASKVVLLASLAIGNVAERSDLRGPLPPAGYDSVHLVAYSTFGKKLDYGETFVFDVAAIKPKYLICFE